MELDRDLILEKADLYSPSSPTRYIEDRKLRELPKIFRHKSYTRKDLKWIVKWKSPRSIHHFQENNTDYIRHIINLVLEDIDVKWKIKHLKTLKGVGVPIASSFLLFIDPKKYTVIDRHGWNTLKYLGSLPKTPSSFTPENYKNYLNKCRKISNKYNVSLRTLNRALYIIDKQNTK